MTVRELIENLLKMPLDKQIMVQDPTEHVDEYGVRCKGYIFPIEGVVRHSRVYLNFKDFRHEKNTEHMKWALENEWILEVIRNRCQTDLERDVLAQALKALKMVAADKGE